jgi:hypothetical protein
VQLSAVALVYLFQKSCPARRALVKVCPEEMHLVCLEVSPLQAAWRVALGPLELPQV